MSRGGHRFADFVCELSEFFVALLARCFALLLGGRLQHEVAVLRLAQHGQALQSVRCLRSDAGDGRARPFARGAVGEHERAMHLPERPAAPDRGSKQFGVGGRQAGGHGLMECGCDDAGHRRERTAATVGADGADH